MKRVIASGSFAIAALLATGCGGVSTDQGPGGPTGTTTITQILPSAGPLAGNIPIQIKGTGFTSANLLVTFGGSAMTNATVVDPQTIHGTLPPSSTAGPVTVTVACQNGSASLPNGFTYSNSTSAITITSVSPTSGPVAGGTLVTLQGTGFSAGTTTVKFGGTAGTGVSVASDTKLTVTTPPASASGPVSVAVANNNGTTSLPNAFIYGSGGGGTGNQTTPEHLGGFSEFDRITSGTSAPVAAGQAVYFTPIDVLYPSPGTCTLDLNQLPGVTTTLDAGAQVTMKESAASLSLAKDMSAGYPVYQNQSGPAASFVLGSAVSISAPGSGALGAFSASNVAKAPALDYSAWMDPLGVQKFSSGGVWSGSSDLWITWGEGTSQGVVTQPVDHVQIILVGQDAAGATHVLQCDIRDPNADAGGGFCVKGGGANDICQTPGATMTSFFTALGGPTTGFAVSNVILYRGNRADYPLPNGSNAALDVAIVKTGSLVMSK